MSSAAVHARAAAWVGATPVPTAAVDAQLERLRAGPHAALLPRADSAEGRQLRRWATQVVVTRALLEMEATARGLAPANDVEAHPLDRQAALELGGIVANVLAHSAAGALVFADVTRSAEVPAVEVAAYYARNGDEFLDPSGQQRPFATVADGIARDLSASLRRRCFLDWLDRRRAALVRLEAGHEHPGDPHQPDATHRH